MESTVRFISIKNCGIEMPNGLQWHNENLFVIDQKTDDIFIIDKDGNLERRLKTVCENGSGITIGDSCIWLGSNGITKSRDFRSTDTHINWILKLDYETGNIISRFPTPDGGGVHGLEWDDGLLWITAFNPTSLILVNPESFKIISSFEIKQSPHGLACQGNDIWCSDRVNRNIIKYRKRDGKILDKIDIPDKGPDPHGLSIKYEILWYADAAFPNPHRPYPEIGWVTFD